MRTSLGNNRTRFLLAAALVGVFTAPMSVPQAAQGVTPKIMIQVTTVGGFIAPSWQASRLPQLTVLTDGTVLADSSILNKGPKPAHSYVREASYLNLSAASSKAFLAAMTLALQSPPGGWGMPPVADMPSTRVLIQTSNSKLDVTISALGYSGAALGPAQTKARLAVTKLIVGMQNSVARTKKAFKPSRFEVWGLTQITDNGGSSGGMGIANPASVYCQSIGGTTGVTDTAAGQAGTCTLPSGETVDEWVNYRAALATLPSWPSGVTVPVSDPNNMGLSCTAVTVTKVAKQLANKDDTGRWLLPSGQALPVILRPVLPGETACQRTW